MKKRIKINKKSELNKALKSGSIKKNNLIKRKKKKEKSIYKKGKKISISLKEKSFFEKVKTDIPNLDKLIGGGFEKNSTNLVVGGAGSAKTIFAMQFLIGGIKKGEKCLYVTFEEKKEQFYKHMLKFGWNLADFEKKGLFTFLEYTPIKVKTMLEEGGGAIESIILRNKISRIVIDSITSFALLFENELEKKEAALNLFNMIIGWNCTSMLTIEEDPVNAEQFASKSLEFEADSIILLYYKMENRERRRYLEILKMRGTDHSKKIHKLDINKKGIKVYK